MQVVPGLEVYHVVDAKELIATTVVVVLCVQVAFLVSACFILEAWASWRWKRISARLTSFELTLEDVQRTLEDVRRIAVDLYDAEFPIVDDVEVIDDQPAKSNGHSADLGIAGLFE